MRMFTIPFYAAYLVLVSCAAPKTTTSSTSSTSPSGRYSEDLSALRPKVTEARDTVVSRTPDKNGKSTTYMEPKFAVNEKIDVVLDSIDRINIARKYVEGFTVQVFSGKREDAVNTRKQLTSLVPDIPSEIQFTEPIFRLKAGKYYNWIDAQADFALIKKYFPAAIVIPEKIPLQTDQK